MASALFQLLDSDGRVLCSYTVSEVHKTPKPSSRPTRPSMALKPSRPSRVCAPGGTKCGGTSTTIKVNFAPGGEMTCSVDEESGTAKEVALDPETIQQITQKCEEFKKALQGRMDHQASGSYAVLKGQLSTEEMTWMEEKGEIPNRVKSSLKSALSQKQKK